MPAPRLTLALERVGPGDWAVFEKFAAEFLAVEFPSLRTMAATQGDKGRDGYLYVPNEEASVAVQYSVTTDWADKINATVRRLGDTFPHVRELIYATNQVIGPAADDLVANLRRKKNISLDIRDRSWFVEREGSAPQRAVASDELARLFVDPLLAERGLREHVGLALSDHDARVAVLHLTLDAQNDATDKGLTKSSFETLVLAALHDTDSQHRVTEVEVVRRVEAMLPAGHETQVRALVLGALHRLAKRRGRVKRHNTTSDYCLSHPEVLSVRARTTEYLLNETALEEELLVAVRSAVDPSLLDGPNELEVVAHDLRAAIETLLLRRGESFATAAASGVSGLLNVTELLAIVAGTARSPANKLTVEQAAFAIFEVMDRPSAAVQQHLRRLADAYTLMAFLRQTPDVQKVVLTMFSEGNIWLDTSVILPLIAETLDGVETQKHYTTLMRAATDAGLKLFLTEGVAEEVERHLNRCLVYARGDYSGGWKGDVPFVYSAYALSGRPRDQFAAWLETFRGLARPVQDVLDYLESTFHIQARNLLEHSDSAPIALRSAAQELWNEAHERRQARRGSDADPFTADRMVAHDVENSVGVIQLRRASSSPLGYREWWLTLDHIAFRLERVLREKLGRDAPHSPVLTPDYLVRLLRLGPLRTAVNREQRAELPLLIELSRCDFVSSELVERADAIRAENRDLDERIVQRRVRDTLDALRATRGPESLAGVKAAEARVLERLRAQGHPERGPA